jgi:hypothetical protein
MAFPTKGALTDRAKLNDILGRAVTVSRLGESDSLDDDLRVLARIGARFLGRAAYAWITAGDQSAEDAHFDAAEKLARRVHTEVSDDAVLQACLFEAIYPQVDTIRIPAWVFEDLEEPVESRTFSYRAMTSDAVQAPAQGLGSPWAGGAVPDLTLPESVRWFYYRARRYMQCGFEALHIGQLHLIAGADHGYIAVERLIQAIRRAAALRARRGWVILDAHSHGVSRDGRLLLDATSRPLSARAITTYPEAVALVRRGTRLGGIHPGGWECDDAPVLLEVDNWHGYSLTPDPVLWLDADARAAAGRWGWDDISWFAHQPLSDRHAFLDYADAWARVQGREWHFQPAVRRPLARAAVQNPDGSRRMYYRANDLSAECRDGFGDESALADLFARRASQAERGAYPPDPAVAELGAEEKRTPSGLDVPEPVAVVGEIQSHIGGIAGDASCPWSTLYPAGSGRFEREFAFPVATDISFTVMTGGTGIDPTNNSGASGGSPYCLRIRHAGQRVRLSFSWEERVLTAVDLEDRSSCLIDPGERRAPADVRMADRRREEHDLPAAWF